MLTDAQCKGAKAKDKAYKLSDSGGLYLYVSETGHRSWRHKYRYGGKERHRTIASYPNLGLRDARGERDADKRLLKQGKDPITEAKRDVLANRLASTDTFELLAREWHAKQLPRWKPIHAADVIESLERDVFGDLGPLPLTEIGATEVLATLKKVVDRNAIETAHRLRQRISAILSYGIGEGRVMTDPAAALGKVLTAKPPSRRWPAATTIGKAREVLEIVDAAEATPVVKLASRFLALTAQRPGMIRWMRWDEIDDFDPNAGSEEAIWIIPASKMKQEIALRDDENFDHPVPLAAAAIEVLREAFKFASGSDYVFPGGRSIRKPMSENALSYLYLRQGLRRRHVPHGWRSSFSTIMNEWVIDHGGGPRDPMIIDLMLAHIPSGISASELRYNRAGYVNRRRKLATIWSKILLEGAMPALELGQGRRRRKF